MFKILIIEDNREKLKNILNVITSKCEIPEEFIDHDIDATSARKLLKTTHYDLLIVDIAIPNKKSDDIDNEGGVKLVNEILERGIYKIPSHILGLTAYSEIFEKAVENLSESIISVVRYSDTDIEWEEKLIIGIRQWKNSKETASMESIDYNYDIAIITAVSVEFEAVKALSSNWERVKIEGDPTYYVKTTFSNSEKKFNVIAACMPQMGMIASSVLCMKLIYNFRPHYLFMPGIAASLKSKEGYGYGDVLVIDESWDGGAGKVGKDEDGSYVFEKNALHLRLDNELSEKIRALKDNTRLLREIKDNYKYANVPNTELNIHIGSVVSVAGVIANEDISQQLKTQDRKLMGLEMEVYGLYYASQNCTSPKPLTMALKSICDFADSKKDDSFQAYAAYTSAQVMYKYILSECVSLIS